MCGRFVGFRNLEQLKQYFPIEAAKCEPVANYNVAPTQKILAIDRLDGSNVLDQYHWGLVPFWAKDTAIGYKMINARSETVATKPTLRAASIKSNPVAGLRPRRWPLFFTQKLPKPLISTSSPLSRVRLMMEGRFLRVLCFCFGKTILFNDYFCDLSLG